MGGVEKKWRRLGDVATDTETNTRGLEVILQIWRLGGHFCGAHGASAPLSSPCICTFDPIFFWLKLIRKYKLDNDKNLQNLKSISDIQRSIEVQKHL